MAGIDIVFLKWCQRVMSLLYQNKWEGHRIYWEYWKLTNGLTWTRETMRTVSHGVSTQNGTRQCRDSMNNIWRSEAEAKPSDVRSECALMSKKYIGNCRCQTCSNPESSCEVYITKSLHVWKKCMPVSSGFILFAPRNSLQGWLGIAGAHKCDGHTKCIPLGVGSSDAVCTGVPTCCWSIWLQ